MAQEQEELEHVSARPMLSLPTAVLDLALVGSNPQTSFLFFLIGYGAVQEVSL